MKFLDSHNEIYYSKPSGQELQLRLLGHTAQNFVNILNTLFQKIEPLCKELSIYIQRIIWLIKL